MYCVLTSIAQQPANPCPANERKQIKPLTCSFTIFILIYLLDTVANWWEIVLKKEAKREANSWNLCWKSPIAPPSSDDDPWLSRRGVRMFFRGREWLRNQSRDQSQISAVDFFFWCGICTGVDIYGLIGDWCSFDGEVASWLVLLCCYTVFYEPCFKSRDIARRLGGVWMLYTSCLIL